MDNRARVEIHPRHGLKMDMVSDAWIQRCTGIAMMIVALGVLALLTTPLIRAMRWW